MTLRPVADMSPADWLVNAPDRWDLLITRGPAGFDSYARVLHTSIDPDRHERRQGCLDDGQMVALREILARHTSKPQQCFNALWEGFGDIDGGEAAGFLTTFAVAPLWPGRIFGREKPRPLPPQAFPVAVINGPRLQLSHREYLLFAGPINEAGKWGATPYAVDIPRDINSPNLLWPQDHSWFVATEIDQDWTGVAGSTALINDLLADPRLEVVRSGEAS